MEHITSGGGEHSNIEGTEEEEKGNHLSYIFGLDSCTKQWAGLNGLPNP